MKPLPFILVVLLLGTISLASSSLSDPNDIQSNEWFLRFCENLDNDPSLLIPAVYAYNLYAYWTSFNIILDA